eukprot:5768818-Prymnesium_polylepis.2
MARLSERPDISETTQTAQNKTTRSSAEGQSPACTPHAQPPCTPLPPHLSREGGSAEGEPS